MTTNDQPMDHVPPDEAADETQDIRSSDLEKNVKQKSTWVRLFFMLVLAFLYGLSRVVIVAVIPYRRKQAALVAETLKRQDIVICTALIPGHVAPTLIDDDMVKSMKPGSVIVDLAIESGGNCTLSQAGEVVDVNGVNIVAHINVPSRLAVDASHLYAKNLLNFLTPFIDDDTGTLRIDWEDELVVGTLIARDGKVVNPVLHGEVG